MYTCLERDLPMEKTTLEHIVLFYQCHEIVASISKDLSWEHYVILIRITDDKKRRFYHDHAIKHLWSANILKKEIADGLYEKSELISPGKPE